MASKPFALSVYLGVKTETREILADESGGKNVQKYSKNADILIHEVYSVDGLKSRTNFWQKYHSDNHTSSYDIAKLAKNSNVKLLVLYHVLLFGAPEEKLMSEIKSTYQGMSF